MPFLGFLTEESPVVTRAVWIISPSGGYGTGQECQDGFSSVPLPNGTPVPERGGGCPSSPAKQLQDLFLISQ